MDAPGKVIAGKYELVSAAGEGGMAVVWKAVARGPGASPKMVAIKRIQHGRNADPAFVAMFEEEARVGIELCHPNIVRILDFGVDKAGGYYLVMEWVEGLDMFQWVRAHFPGIRETPWRLVVAIGVEVCRALAAAHERHDARGELVPVYHRDVSPSNVLLGTSGVVKLGDFGLARAMDRASMTRPNVIKGKLAYCAPELVQGSKPSAQSDLFSLGVVLFEALTQRRLFTGKNDLEVLLAIRRAEIPPLDALRTGLPGALSAVMATALAPTPEARFMSASEMARALLAILRSESDEGSCEALGASVRHARARLSEPEHMGAEASLSASVQALSLGDLEVVSSAGSSVEVELITEKGPAPPPVTKKKERAP